MLERRNSDRIRLPSSWCNEINGDYFYTFQAADLSEEGIFLRSRMLNPGQAPFSKLTFKLPNGTLLKNVTARLVREHRTGALVGSAFEFMNLTEEQRLELRRFFNEYLLKGSA
jgi:hypothetical protein